MSSGDNQNVRKKKGRLRAAMRGEAFKPDLGTLTAKEECCLEGLHILETLITRDLWIPAKIIEKYLVGSSGYALTRAASVAYCMNKTSTLDILCRLGANVNGMDSKGNNMLHRAVMLNRPDRVEIVLEIKRVLLMSRNKFGKIPLHLAAEEGQRECVEILLKAVKGLVQIDLCLARKLELEQQITLPWHVFLQMMQLSDELFSLETLIQELEGCGYADMPDNLGRTPLYLAAQGGKVEGMRALLKAGADPNAADNERSRPLHAAAYSGCEMCVQTLLKASVDLQARDRNKQTALHIAAFWGRASVAQMLISAGADVEANDKRRRTPLHLAAFEGHAEVVKILLAAHACTSVKDVRGKMPRDGAKRHEIVDML